MSILKTLEADVEGFVLKNVSVPAVEKQIITILVGKLSAAQTPEARVILTDIQTAVNDAIAALPPVTTA